MLACADGSLYTGVATDLNRRLRQHNGELVGGAKYTSSRRPVRVVWQEACACRAEAQQREASIKKLDRLAKPALVGAS